MAEIEEALKLPLKDFKNQFIDLQIIRAWIYLEKQEPEKSCDMFENARDLSPQSLYQKMAIHQGFANCYKAQKKFEKALAEIVDSLKIPSLGNREFIDLQIIRAGIYLDKQDSEKSCETLQKARDLSPQLPDQKIAIHQGFAHCYKAQKKFEKALAEIDEALKLPSTAVNSQSAYLLTFKGQIFSILRRRDISQKLFQQALFKAKEDSQKVQIYSELAQISRKIDVTKSLNYYKKILNIVGADSDDFKIFTRQYFTLNLKRELKKKS